MFETAQFIVNTNEDNRVERVPDFSSRFKLFFGNVIHLVYPHKRTFSLRLVSKKKKNKTLLFYLDKILG